MLSKKYIQVQGMSCKSCESRIDSALLKANGVISSHSDFRTNTVEIGFTETKPDTREVETVLSNLGYKPIRISDEPIVRKWEWIQSLGIGIAIFAVFTLFQNTIGITILPKIDPNVNLAILFVIGLITSVHCVAMCGGIGISQSLGKASETGEKKGSTSRTLLYNTGRLISYTLLGGILGALGSVFQISDAVKSGITILAGILMAIIGLNIAGAFRFLQKYVPAPPKFIASVSRFLYRFGPFGIGLLNGLIPCGPLQGMQLYALGSGGFLQGALAMAVFGAGTIPLMFGLGSVIKLFSGKHSQAFVRVGAILVILIGFVMVNRGLSLSGNGIAVVSKETSPVTVKDGYQEVRSIFTASEYASIKVHKDIPVRWVIIVDQNDLNGCNQELIIPAFGIRKSLQAGENIIKFVPNESGNFQYSCWMGMIVSTISVDDGKGNWQSGQPERIQTPKCSCCGGRS